MIPLRSHSHLVRPTSIDGVVQPRTHPPRALPVVSMPPARNTTKPVLVHAKPMHTVLLKSKPATGTLGNPNSESPQPPKISSHVQPAPAHTSASLQQPEKHRAKQLLTNFGIILLAVAVALSFFDQRLGQWVIIASGFISLALRLDSRWLFGGALFALVMIPVLTALGRQPLAENYAVYAFLLLVFGTIRSMFEVKNTSHGQEGLYKLHGR